VLQDRCAIGTAVDFETGPRKVLLARTCCAAPAVQHPLDSTCRASPNGEAPAVVDSTHDRSLGGTWLIAICDSPDPNPRSRSSTWRKQRDGSSGSSRKRSLASSALVAFDAVVLGAPEELKTQEVNALERFVRRRGGTVVVMPDRRPAGSYLRLLPTNSFSELLVEKPLELSSEIAGMRATELALPLGDLPDVDVLATATVGQTVRPAVFAVSLGLGRVIFSGALDAWRFRALSDGGFARFWESCIADAARAGPRRMEVTLAPTVTAPGEDVRVCVRLRPTEILDSTESVRVPPVTAHLLGEWALRRRRGLA
jgi:hypothetical protein